VRKGEARVGETDDQEWNDLHRVVEHGEGQRLFARHAEELQRDEGTELECPHVRGCGWNRDGDIHGEEHEKRGGDPDAELGPGDVLRKVRLQLAQMEEQLEGSGQSTLAREVRGEARWTDSIVQQCGTESDKQEMERLRAQLEKYIESEDQRGIKWAQEQLRELRAGILDNQPWFWQNVLAFLRKPGRRFLNKAEANRWLAKAEQAEQTQNLPAMKEAVVRVWEMQPPDQVELSKQQAAQSGLRQA